MDSQYFSAGALLGVLLAVVAALLLALFAGGALLRLSVRWIEKTTPGYWRCVGAMALACAFGAVMQFGLGVVLSVVVPPSAMLFATEPGQGFIGIAIVATVVSLGIATLALALSVLLVVPAGDGRRMGFARACAVGALSASMFLGLYAVCVAIPLLTLGGVPGVSR